MPQKNFHFSGRILATILNFGGNRKCCLSEWLNSLYVHEKILRKFRNLFESSSGGLLLHQDYNTRQDVSELLAMLLFDEVAKVTSRSEDEAAVDVVIGFSLPKFVTKR